MSDRSDTIRRPAARPGRCSDHPDEMAVASCAVCERPLCLACAIPVRGRVVGAECLSSVVEDPPPHPEPLPPPPRRGHVLAIVGFGIVLVASIFPWRQSAVASSGPGDAWTLHWSLIAMIAAAAGLIAAIAGWRRVLRAPLAAAIYAGCAIVVLLGTILDVARPPTLSSVAGAIPWRIVIVGAVLALAAAALAASGTRRPS
jgi:hypothetical protein